MKWIIGTIAIFAIACAASTEAEDAGTPALPDAAATPDAAPDHAIDAAHDVAVDAAAVEGGSTLHGDVDAKIFGYMFGDGDFYTDTPPPTNPSYYAAAPDVVADVLDLGCANGYSVQFDGKPYTCGSTKPTTKGSIVVEAFVWPNGGDLSAMTAQDELEAFFSGLLIGEGSRGGLCDDQFPNIPAGHYTTAAATAAHVGLVKDALSRAGFTTAHVSAKNDASCSGDTCREARVDASEFCKFAGAGYSFVKYDRVPGSIASGTTYAAPKPCN